LKNAIWQPCNALKKKKKNVWSSTVFADVFVAAVWPEMYRKIDQNVQKTPNTETPKNM
jgi:hypothetical protein